MNILKKAAVASSIVISITIGGAGTMFGWHGNLSASQECVANEGVYRDTYVLTNPAEPWWNSTNLEQVITDPAGLVFDKSTLQYGESATAVREVRGDTVGSDARNVKFHWVNKTTGTIHEPKDASASVTHEGTCIPQVTSVDFIASVECVQEGGPHGTSVFTLLVSQTSPAPPQATFEPANGTKLDSGEPVTVTATWHDEFHGDQTKTITTDPVAMCTTTAPPPEKPVELAPPAVLTNMPQAPGPQLPGGELAKTGDMTSLLATAGIGSVIIGGLVVWATRRKTSVA